LLKILHPAFFVRDRPDRASSTPDSSNVSLTAAQTMAGQLPQGQESRRIELHLLERLLVTSRQRH
jgi:hypothetical protein